MYGGGVIEIHFEGTRIDVIDLPAAEFALVALLIKCAREGRDWGDAFLTSKDLAKLAVTHDAGLTDDPERIPHVVHQFRRRIAKRFRRGYTTTTVITGKEFANGMLQHHATLGYRLGLPPENLHLRLIGNELGAAPDDPKIF
jgi:hypothetical protein